MFTQDAFPVLHKQTYRAMNRGDMYVPNVGVSAPLMAAGLATPKSGHMPIHSVPVTYSQVKSRLLGVKGMPTPVKAVNPSGS